MSDNQNWYKLLSGRINRTSDFLYLRNRKNIPIFVYDEMYLPTELTQDLILLGRAVTIRSDFEMRKKFLGRKYGYSIPFRSVSESEMTFSKGKIEGDVYLVPYTTILFLDDWYQNNSIFFRQRTHVMLKEQEMKVKTPSKHPLLNPFIYLLPNKTTREMDVNMFETSTYFSQTQEKIYSKSKIDRG